MNSSLDKALHYLTGNENVDAVTIEDLEKLVDNYPYFPVGHFLLSKKLKKENHTNFLSEVQKTALYFPNPYWLHYQLLNDLPEEPVVYDNTEMSSNGKEHFDKEEFEAVIENKISVDENITDTPVASENIDNEHPVTTAFSPEEIQAASKLAHETLKTENNLFEDKRSVQEVSSLPDEALVNVVIAEGEGEAPVLLETNGEHMPEMVEDEPAISHGHNDPPIFENEPEAFINYTDETAIEVSADIEETDTKITVSNEIEGIKEPDVPKPEEDEHEKMFQNIKAMLDASSAETNAGEKSTIVPIDPYYTIDYFAAQGIKLDLEKNPQDKLGKQVKKFTQWLRHMKKLGPEDALAAEGPSPAEVEAQQTAEASNIAREVVTEAMALVLEKQGKKDKAIQLYRKLTFLNTHKSAYFADKINHLNSL